jgi:iron complex outermembrane receptor protein
VSALAWCGVASAEAPAAPAADSGGDATKVQEVVITADRRTTALQKTAIAATVLTGDQLTKNGVFTVDQLQFVSPSLAVDNFGQGNDIDIRGIGKGEHNTQTGTGVVTYRDGAVTFPGYFAEEPYYDIASVEVLRGPQGTFAGQNATGGAIIVNTNNPVIGGGHDGYLLAHYGNYNDTGLQGAVNLPISDTLAARVAFNTEYRDTFYKISGPWTGDPNVKWGSLRLSLLWTPAPNLTVSWKTDASYLDNGGYFGDKVTNKGTSHLFDGFGNNYPTYAVDDFVRSTLKVDYVMQSGITLRSVTSAQTGRTSWTGDIDGLADPHNSTFITEAVDETLLSQEFNLISPNTGPLKWVLGAYYQSNVYNFPFGQFDIGFPFGGGTLDEDLAGTNRTHSAAVFGQVSYALTDRLELSVGARYSTWYTKNIGHWYVPQLLGFGFDFPILETFKGQNLTGKVNLNWNLDDHNFLYAFVATGAKPGGLNVPLIFGGGSIPAPFGQEYVTDYEVGWKSTMMDGHLHTQLGGYYNAFQHFQVIIPIPNFPTQSTELNVPGRTKLYGLEASAQGVFGHFSFDVGTGIAHSSVADFYSQDPRLPITGFCNPSTGPAVGGCKFLGGHPQTYAPNFTFNVGAQYEYEIADGDTVTPRLSFSHVSQQWSTLFDNAAAGDFLTPRDIANATIAWKHGSLLTTIYAYNLNNDHYVSAAAAPIRLAGAPRQFGISVMKTF